MIEAKVQKSSIHDGYSNVSNQSNIAAQSSQIPVSKTLLDLHFDELGMALGIQATLVSEVERRLAPLVSGLNTSASGTVGEESPTLVNNWPITQCIQEYRRQVISNNIRLRELLDSSAL